MAGPTGKIIFSNLSSQVDSTTSLDLTTPNLQDQFNLASNQPASQRYQIYESDDFYQVTFELRNRFEAVGTLYITTPKEIVSNTINANFGVARIASAVVLIAFAIYVYGSASLWMGEEETGWSKSGIRLLAGSYGAGFLVVAVLVTYALLNTYVSGIQSRSRALTDSLAYRLNAALEIGLSLQDFQGVDEVFNGYKALNPDLSFVALTENNQVVIHTNSNQIGALWAEDTSQFEYTASLAKTATSSQDEFALHLGVPKNIVYQRLWDILRD